MHQVMKMKDHMTEKTIRTEERRLPALGAACLLGALAGSLCCSRVEALQRLMQNQLEGQQTLWQHLLPDGILLLVMLAAGFFRAGCLIALLTSTAKGFWLSAAATLGVIRLGNGGYALSLVVWFLPGFLSMTALLLLGRQAMGWAAARSRLPAGRGKRLLPDGTYYGTAVICMGILLLSAAIAVRILPGLWATVSTFLPAK